MLYECYISFFVLSSLCFYLTLSILGCYSDLGVSANLHISFYPPYFAVVLLIALLFSAVSFFLLFIILIGDSVYEDEEEE